MSFPLFEVLAGEIRGNDFCRMKMKRTLTVCFASEMVLGQGTQLDVIISEIMS